MTVKEQLKHEIDHLDEHYLELLYKIVRQFPRVHQNKQAGTSGQDIASLFQEIADSGGLGIKDPLEWQRTIRKDRPLPFREA
jgi:hypothetical protein